MEEGDRGDKIEKHKELEWPLMSSQIVLVYKQSHKGVRTLSLGSFTHIFNPASQKVETVAKDELSMKMSQ